MSRNNTFIVVNHRPVPKHVINASKMKKGNQIIFIPGVSPKIGIISNRTIKASMKSTLPDNTADNGIINLGK